MYGFDSDLPAGYNDADLETRELEERAAELEADELEAVNLAEAGQTSMIVPDEDRPLPGLAPDPFESLYGKPTVEMKEMKA